MAQERSTPFPHDRLTRLSEVGMEAVQRDPGYEGDRVIVLVDCAAEGKGGFVLCGYDSAAEAVEFLTRHIIALQKVSESQPPPVWPI